MEQLDLTDAQRSQIEALKADMKADREALAKQSLTAEERKVAMKQIKEEYKTALDAILTDSQRAQFAEMKADRKRKFGKRGDRADKQQRRQDRAAKMADELDLTEAQRSQMAELMQAQKEEMKQLREQDLTKEERKAAAKEIRERYKTQQRSLLTASQQAKLDDMRADRKGKKGRKRGLSRQR